VAIPSTGSRAATICFEKLKRFPAHPPDVPGLPLLACGDHGLPLDLLGAFKAIFRTGSNGGTGCIRLRISGGNPELDLLPSEGTTLKFHMSFMKRICSGGQLRIRFE
jgi:hypothetical protein